MAPKSKKNHIEEESSGFSEISRRFKAHPFLFGGTVLVLVIVIVAFVLVPAIPNVGIDSRSGNFVFGYYNGKPIAHNYNNFFDRTLRELAWNSGFDLQSDYSRNSGPAYQIWYGAFFRTVIHTAILDEMSNSGYKAPAKEIDRLVASLPDFQEDGRFSIVKYSNFDKNRLLSLRNITEENFITGRYMEDISALRVSSAEKAFIGAMASPERTFEMVSFSRSAYPDTEVSAFAEANPDLFRVTHLSRITLGSEKEALQVLDSVQSGRLTFEDAARNHSTDADKDKGGDMGLRMAYELFTEITDETNRTAVFSRKKGELSSVMSAPDGKWIFFRAEETPYAPDLSQDVNLGKVRAYMSKFEGGRIENWVAAKVEEILDYAKQKNISISACIESLKEQPEELSFSPLIPGAVTGIIGPVNLNYGNLGGAQTEWNLRLFPNTLNTENRPELENAATNENFWRIAFTIPLGVPSAPFTLEETMVILTATEETVTDEINTDYITNFYVMGWMANALEAELNSAILRSEKLENNFFTVFFPLLTPGSTGAAQEE